MPILKIDSDKIRSDAAVASTRAMNIADESSATTAQIDALVAGEFTGTDGIALKTSMLEVKTALNNITATLQSLSQGMNIVAGNFDNVESTNASGFAF